MATCAHTNHRIVLDMPLADPTTFAFLGRFDVDQCVDCFAILSKKPTTYNDPNPLPPAK